MRHLRVLPLVLLVASATLASPAYADPADDAFAREADSANDVSELLAAKTRPLLTRDPRFAPLMAEVKRAGATKDKTARKAQLDALAPRVLALRDDVAKRAGLDIPDTARKLAPLNARLVRRLAKAPLPTGMKLGETSVTSFPKPWSFKNNCPDADDKWDFDGNKVMVRAESAIADKDCGTIMAGRGAVFKIPPGAKKLTINLRAKLDLDVLAASAGAYGKASGFFGVRLHLLQGSYGTVTVNGAQVTMTSQIHKLINLVATNSIPNPIPVNTDSLEDTIQEGDDGTTLSAILPPNPGQEIEVTLITGGRVDADLQGYASLSNDLTPQSLKVAFFN